MDVSIVIPNYNGAQLLEKNLPKVIKATRRAKGAQLQNVEIIIVDDGSTDKSVGLVKNEFPHVKLVENTRNKGFASAVNTGVKQVRGEIIVLLNTDVTPEKEFLKPLLQNFRDEKVFAVGCLDKSVEDSKVIKRGRGVAWWERGFLVHKRGEVNKTDTFWVSGGSGAFRKSIWNKLGGMDELYNPFYWEDIDLSYRAQKAGYKILFEPKSIVIHKHDKGAIKSQFTPQQMKTIAYRNQFYFIWKNIDNTRMLVSHLLWLPLHFAQAVLRYDLPFFNGFAQALFNVDKVWKKRQQ